MKDPMPMKPAAKTKKNANRAGTHSGLGREIQSKIGQHLRTMFDDVVKEGVPDRFAEMLRQLDEPRDKEPRK